MTHADLQDDMLKLVRYKMLFVKRGYEVAFPEREELISESMDESSFAAWKVSEFLQELTRGALAMPKKWVEQGYPPSKYICSGSLCGLPEEDKKYLRVAYEVLERYAREKPQYSD